MHAQSIFGHCSSPILCNRGSFYYVEAWWKITFPLDFPAISFAKASIYICPSVPVTKKPKPDMSTTQDSRLQASRALHDQDHERHLYLSALISEWPAFLRGLFCYSPHALQRPSSSQDSRSPPLLPLGRPSLEHHVLPLLCQLRVNFWPQLTNCMSK